MTEMENPAVLDLLKRLEEDNETKANNNNNNNRENVPSLLSDDCAGGYVATAVAATAAAASNVTAERNPDGDLNKATTISKSKKRHVSNTNTDPKIKKQKKKEVKKKTRSSNAFTGKNKTNGKLKNPPSANESGVSIVKKTDVLAATEIITNPTSVSTTAVANAKPVPNKQSSPSDVIQLTVVNPGLKDIDRGQQCNDVAYSGIVTDKNAVMMKDDSLDRDTTKVNTASNSNSTFSLKAASEPETLVDKPKKGAQSNKTITEKMVSKNTKVAYKPEKTVWDNTDSPEATTKPVTNKNLGTNVAIQKISSCEEFSLSTDNHAAPRWLQDRVDQIKNETKSVLDSRKLFLEMTIHDQATQDMKEDIPTLVLWGAPKAGKTTTALYLAGTMFQEDEVDGMDHYTPITFPQHKLSTYTVGCRSTPTSTSIFQAVALDGEEEKPKVAICDTPSCWNNTMTTKCTLEHRLATILSFRQSFQSGKFKPVLVFHLPTMRVNHYQELRDTLQSVHGIVSDNDLRSWDYVFTGCSRKRDKNRIHKELAAVLRRWTTEQEELAVGQEKNEPFWILLLSHMIAKTTPVAHVIDPIKKRKATGILTKLLGYNKGEDDDSSSNNNNEYAATSDGLYVSSLYEGERSLPASTEDMQQMKLHVECLVTRYAQAHAGRFYELACQTMSELEFLAKHFPVASAAYDRLMSRLCSDSSWQGEDTYCHPELEELAKSQAMMFIEQAIQMTREEKEKQQVQKSSSGGDDDDDDGTPIESISFRRENLTADSTFQGDVFDFIVRKVAKQEFEKNGTSIVKTMTTATTTTDTAAKEDRREKLKGVMERHVDLIDSLEHWYRKDSGHKNTIQRAEEQLIQGAKVIIQEDLDLVETGLSDLSSVDTPSSLLEEVKKAIFFLFDIHKYVRSKFPVHSDKDVYIDPWSWLDAVPNMVMKHLIENTRKKTKQMESTLEGIAVHKEEDVDGNNKKDDGPKDVFILFCLWRTIRPFLTDYNVDDLLKRFEVAAMALVTKCVNILDEAAHMLLRTNDFFSDDGEITERDIADLLHGARVIYNLVRNIQKVDPIIFADEASKFEYIMYVLQHSKKKCDEKRKSSCPFSSARDKTYQPKENSQPQEETQIASTSNATTKVRSCQKEQSSKRKLPEDDGNAEISSLDLSSRFSKRTKWKPATNPRETENSSTSSGKQRPSSSNNEKTKKSNEKECDDIDISVGASSGSFIPEDTIGRPHEGRNEITDRDSIQSGNEVLRTKSQRIEQGKVEGGDSAFTQVEAPVSPLLGLTKKERCKIKSIDGGVRWIDRYDKYIQFVSNDGHFNSLYRQQEMIPAMDWFEAERKKWKRGDLPDACKIALVKAGMKLSDDEMQSIQTAEWKRLFKQVKDHKKRRNAFPRHSSGMLGTWFYTQIYFLELWRATGEYPGHEYDLAEEHYKIMKGSGVPIFESVHHEAGTPEGDKKRKARLSASTGELDATREQSAGGLKPATRSVGSSRTDTTVSVRPQQRRKKRKRASLILLKPLDTVYER